jgi:glucose/mannose-6-phosphate isomerase
MLPQAILDFPAQFAFEPKIENESNLHRKNKFAVCGMGGSQLPADIIRTARPERDLLGWRDYGLPPGDLGDRLIIISSYSGNTEEEIDAFEAAFAQQLSIAVITKGGKLLELVREKSVPYVLIPDTGIQPRQATGFMVRAMLALMGDDEGLKATRALTTALDPSKPEAPAKNLAAALKDSVPVIYASLKNAALARNWKIKLNETGKIPAFWNVLPEVNHNEMTGFDTIPETKKLSGNFRFIFLEDPADDPRIAKRMSILKGLYEKRGLSVEVVSIGKGEPYQSIFSNLLLADWTAYHTAQLYGVEPDEVPMVEEFKKLV